MSWKDAFRTELTRLSAFAKSKGWKFDGVAWAHSRRKATYKSVLELVDGEGYNTDHIGRAGVDF